MKTIAGLGKVLTTLFWCVVLANLINPFAQPFAQLLALAGAGVALLHVFKIVAFKAILREQPRPALARAQVLLFGSFHLCNLARPETAQAVQEGAVHA